MSFNKIITTISDNNKNHKTIDLFRILFYGWLLVYYNTLAFNVNYFFGKESFIPKDSLSLIFGQSFLNLFKFDFFNTHPLIVIFFLNVFIFLGLFNSKNRIWPLLIYYFVLLLDARSYFILDGGNNLVVILAVYNVLFYLQEDKNTSFSKLCSSLSNLSLLMARIQVCLVYYVAGHTKLTGDLWTNGTALYYTLSVSEVSLESVRNLIKHINPIFIVASTYSVIVFQVCFPFLIWIKKIRRYVVTMGMLIHVGISFVMGLTFFGYILCISYCVFYDEEEVNMIISRFKFLNEKIKFLKTAL